SGGAGGSAGGVSRSDHLAQPGGSVLSGDSHHSGHSPRHGHVAPGPRARAAAAVTIYASPRSRRSQMTCAETRNLLNAYVDGELDLVHSLQIEQHLQGCAACSQAYKNQQALGAAIGASSLYFAAPVGLHKRIQESVRQAAQAQPT